MDGLIPANNDYNLGSEVNNAREAIYFFATVAIQKCPEKDFINDSILLLVEKWVELKINKSIYKLVDSIEDANLLMDFMSVELEFCEGAYSDVEVCKMLGSYVEKLSVKNLYPLMTDIRLRLGGYSKLIVSIIDSVCNIKSNGVRYDEISKYITQQLY